MLSETKNSKEENMTHPNFQYKFDEFLLDPQNGFLLRNEQLVPLTWRAFKVLELLVENEGRVVAKQDFMETVWKDCFVEDGSLAVAINSIRKVIHTDGQKLIQTFSGRGYRFSGRVEKIAVKNEPIQKQVTQTFLTGNDIGQDFETTAINSPVKINTLNKVFGFFAELIRGTGQRSEKSL